MEAESSDISEFSMINPSNHFYMGKEANYMLGMNLFPPETTSIINTD